MGTTLTGTTPQDTYDSLIKVTDNGPLSGTLKTLTDGLGNDSTLSLSTTAASIAGTLSVTGNAAFDTSTLFVDAAANEVGVGTSSPAYRFNVVTNAISGRQNLAAINRTAQNFVTFTNPQFATDASMGLMLRVFPQSDPRQGAGIIASGGVNNAATDLDLFVSTSPDGLASTSYSAVKIQSSGNVGIGTSSPTGKLTVSQANSGGVAAILLTEDESTIQGPSANTYLKMGGNLTFGAAGVIPIQIATTEVLRVTSNGLTFNGDTAAANALDDYEEGTFTPSVEGSSTAGTANYYQQNGRYTKIGRVVHFQLYLAYDTGTGSGSLRIGNLPFTSANVNLNNAVSIGFFDVVGLTALNVATAIVIQNSQSIGFLQYPVGGGGTTDIAYDSAANISVSGTYIV